MNICLSLIELCRARRRRVPRPGQKEFGFLNHLQTSFSLDMIGTLFKADFELLSKKLCFEPAVLFFLLMLLSAGRWLTKAMVGLIRQYQNLQLPVRS